MKCIKTMLLQLCILHLSAYFLVILFALIFMSMLFATLPDRLIAWRNISVLSDKQINRYLFTYDRDACDIILYVVVALGVTISI